MASCIYAWSRPSPAEDEFLFLSPGPSPEKTHGEKEEVSLHIGLQVRPPSAPQEGDGLPWCGKYRFRDACHPNLTRTFTTPPPVPPRALKFVGIDGYTIPPLPPVPPYTYKPPTRPCTISKEEDMRNRAPPRSTVQSGLAMGFGHGGFEALPPQCKRGFVTRSILRPPAVRYAVSFHGGNIVKPALNYPMNPCAVCHTHAWQAPEIKLIIAITTRDEIPPSAKGCFAYCEALGYPVIRAPWLEADAYFKNVVAMWGCVEKGMVNDTRFVQWVYDNYEFNMSYEGSFARWLTPLVVMSVVTGTPLHELQRWAFEKPDKLAALADSLPQEARYAFVLGGDTIAAPDYGSKVWDYIVDRSDYVGQALLPFIAASREFSYGYPFGSQLKHSEWPGACHNADVLLFNVPCMAVKYADIMREARINGYWGQRLNTHPLDQTPVWAINFAGGMVTMAQEMNYPAAANRICLFGPEPDREILQFHFYVHKPGRFTHPHVIGIPMLEPFAMAYCSGVRAAATAGFVDAKGEAVAQCAQYAQLTRHVECLNTTLLFPGGHYTHKARKKARP